MGGGGEGAVGGAFAQAMAAGRVFVDDAQGEFSTGFGTHRTTTTTTQTTPTAVSSGPTGVASGPES